MQAMSRRTDRGDPDAQQSVAVGVPSKEELQSINEELQTVNAELNVRIDELSRANSDITNLLESTQIATLFLDRNLALKNFTPAAKDLFRLIESDVGRPITDIRVHFDADTVAKEFFDEGFMDGGRFGHADDRHGRAGARIPGNWSSS